MSSLNVASNQTVPNLVIAGLDDTGRTCFYTQQTVHLLADGGHEHGLASTDLAVDQVEVASPDRGQVIVAVAMLS